MKQREEVIENYVRAYNTFDVPGMTADFHADIVFENIQNGEVTLSLEGISAFIEQVSQPNHFSQADDKRSSPSNIMVTKRKSILIIMLCLRLIFLMV